MLFSQNFSDLNALSAIGTSNLNPSLLCTNLYFLFSFFYIYAFVVDKSLQGRLVIAAPLPYYPLKSLGVQQYFSRAIFVYDYRLRKGPKCRRKDVQTVQYYSYRINISESSSKRDDFYSIAATQAMLKYSQKQLTPNPFQLLINDQALILWIKVYNCCCCCCRCQCYCLFQFHTNQTHSSGVK